MLSAEFFEINERPFAQIVSKSGKVQKTISGENATIFQHLVEIRDTAESAQLLLEAWASAPDRDFWSLDY